MSATLETPQNPTEGSTAAPSPNAPPVAGQTAAPAAETKAAETKPAGLTTQAEVKEAADKKATTPEAPKTYSPFKYEEGRSLHPDVEKAFTDVALKHGLSQEAAQDFVSTLLSAHDKRVQGMQSEIKANYAKALAADPELSKAENLAVANKAYVEFGSEELRSFAEANGLIHFPPFIRAWFKAGQAIQGDTFVKGAAPQRTSDPLAGLYNNSKMN